MMSRLHSGLSDFFMKSSTLLRLIWWLIFNRCMHSFYVFLSVINSCGPWTLMINFWRTWIMTWTTCLTVSSFSRTTHQSMMCCLTSRINWNPVMYVAWSPHCCNYCAIYHCFFIHKLMFWPNCVNLRPVHYATSKSFWVRYTTVISVEFTIWYSVHFMIIWTCPNLSVEDINWGNNKPVSFEVW